MSKYYTRLAPGKHYHLFNHAVGDEVLFRNDDNFGFFLKKYGIHTDGICDTLSYNLMPNHFHFSVRIKSFQDCITKFEKVKEMPFNSQSHDISDFLMERFSNLCNSYTKSYNKYFDQKGVLFNDYMKRIEIQNEKYLCNLINYIHFNATHHGFCKNPLDWKWTSLHAFLANKETRIKRDEVFEKFGGIKEFKVAHAKMVTPLSEYEFI